jgi:glycosyltransferase involved in cell wall biosynthesis
MEKKTKVLIGCLYFFNRTGSEMYVFDLSRFLVKMGCDVTVVSYHIDGPLPDVARELGIKVFSFDTLPQHTKYDIIHTQHRPVTLELIRRFSSTKKIATIHSEVLDAEYPIIHQSIMKYIGIRPKIVEMLNKKFGIPNEKIELIYNPIDNEKFVPLNVEGSNSILFVGTLDYLRRASLFDMVEHTKSKNMELWIVGKNHSDFLPALLQNNHVKYFDPTPDVEQYIHRCHETAGILLGRTTIEGWMCGKGGWIYEIDEGGNILSKEFFDPPSDIEKFYASNVATQIMNEYKKIIG